MNDVTGRQNRKEGAERACSAIAARQHGLITRRQATDAGLSPRSVDRRLAAGHLTAVYRGIYRVAGAPRSWRQELLAACLWAGGVASHRAAAALWKLNGIEEAAVEVTSPKKLRSSQRVLVHCGSLVGPEITSVGSIPTTSAARTLLDLGAVVEREVLEASLTDALQRGLTTIPRLQRILDKAGGKGRRGAKALRSILKTVRDQRVESILELKVLRLLRRANLPAPISQFGVLKNGAIVARVDFAYPEIRLAIEADGFRYHGSRQAWKRDLIRRNALASLGWRVVHVTWEDVVDRPAEAVREIRNTLHTLAQGSSFRPGRR